MYTVCNYISKKASHLYTGTKAYLGNKANNVYEATTNYVDKVANKVNLNSARAVGIATGDFIGNANFIGADGIRAGVVKTVATGIRTLPKIINEGVVIENTLAPATAFLPSIFPESIRHITGIASHLFWLDSNDPSEVMVGSTVLTAATISILAGDSVYEIAAKTGAAATVSIIASTALYYSKDKDQDPELAKTTILQTVQKTALVSLNLGFMAYGLYTSPILSSITLGLTLWAGFKKPPIEHNFTEADIQNLLARSD